MGGSRDAARVGGAGPFGPRLAPRISRAPGNPKETFRSPDAEELRNQEAAIRKKLEDPAYRKLLLEAQFVNKLIDQRVLSLTELSARLAGLLPEDAHLTGLALTSPKKPGEDYLLRLGITAKSEDAIDTFLNDLEDAPDFKDVSITNQGFQEEGSQAQQIILLCTARYLPGTDISTGKPSAAESTSNSKSNR